MKNPNQPTHHPVRRALKLIALIALALILIPDSALAQKSKKVASGGDGNGRFIAVAGDETITVRWSAYQTWAVVHFYDVCALPDEVEFTADNCNQSESHTQVSSDTRSFTFTSRYGIKNKQQYKVSVRPSVHDYLPYVKVTPQR